MAHPSDAREQPEHEVVDVDLQPRPWVALSSIATVVGADDERAFILVPGASDLALDLQSPLRGASYVILPDRLVPDPRSFSFPYILAACSDRVLFMATTGDGSRRFAYYLGDAHARTAACLPDVPADLRLELALRRSVGLIADPRHGGDYLVAQLHPPSTTRHDTLLCYSTFSGEWIAKPLASSPDHGRWGANGMLTHGGFMWWVDIAQGMLVCDPSAAAADLHLAFVPLPDGSAMHLGDGPRPTSLLNKLRFIRPSQGKLRYVEISLSPLDEPEVVRVFTLASMEGPEYWVQDFTATFSDIRGHPSYAEAGLPKDAVPSLVLIDPNDPKIVYFFHDTTLFGVDLVATEVVLCLEYVVDASRKKMKFQSSCFVQAWELPPDLILDDESMRTHG